jgi:hypothetical protein
MCTFNCLKIGLKILSFLGVILLIVISSSYLVFQLKQQSNKWQFKTKAFTESHIKQIVVLKTDLYKNGNGFEWKDDNEELVIQNTFYEVANVFEHGSYAIISLIEDSSETSFFADVIKALNESPIHTYLQLLLSLDFNLPTPIKDFDLTETILNYSTEQIHNFTDGFSCLIIQPPKLSFC